MQPLESPAAPGAPLYEAFYGLREQPFALSTDPRFLFMTASHRRAHEELLTGLRRREGLLLLTGETGTGKTTLGRAVLNAMGPRTFSATILNPYMTGPEVLRVVLRDFGLVSQEEIRRGAFDRADLPQLLETLESFLRSLIPLDSHAVVLIDEAQSLSAEVLDHVRMLGAYEQDGQRLLQIVLCGQPRLRDTLQTEPLRALNERITRRTSLAPLPPDDIEGYIRHRLAVAGRPDAVHFAPDAIRLIAELSSGVPRRVNMLCDRALEDGRSTGTTIISADAVRRAAKALAGGDPDALTVEGASAVMAKTGDVMPHVAARSPHAGWTGRRWWSIAGALVVATALAGGYYAWSIGNAAGLLHAPPDPTLTGGLAPGPLPPPSDDEIRSQLAGIGGGSDQFPDDRHQID